MSFISTDFTFNGVASSTHGVKLIKSDDGMIGTIFACPREIKETYVSYRDKPWFYRLVYKPIDLKMEFTLTSDNAWTEQKRQDIFNWLYSPRTYKDFVSDDDVTLVYKVIFTSPIIFKTFDYGEIIISGTPTLCGNGILTLEAKAMLPQIT
jgi:phage-related protein